MFSDTPSSEQPSDKPTELEVMDALHIAVQKGLLKFEKGPFKKSHIPYLMLAELVHLHYTGKIRGSISSMIKRRVSSKASGEQLETILYSDSRTRGRFDSLCNTWIPSLNKEPSIPIQIVVTREPFTIDFTQKLLSANAVEAKNEPLIPDPEFSAPSAKPPVCRLPVAGIFIGRDKERDEALAHWRADRKRPLLIWGTPAIGKSTLALALLQHPEIEKQFGVRRYQFRCDGLKSAGDVKQQMAHRWLDIDPRSLAQADIPQIERAIINQLSTAPAACIIDNFEEPHREDAVNCEEWLRILLGIEGVWLIVTTQGFYKPGGIHWCKALQLSRLSPEFALDLFCEITDREAHRSDPRLPSLLEDMAGIPHAIELLAHQAVHTDDLGDLIDRWNAKGTKMLERLGEDSRETSLAAAYDFAIKDNRVVGEAGRRLLRALACLPQGVHEAADVAAISEAVGAISSWDAADLLVRAALAYRDSDRLRILSPLRDHVLRMHPASPEELQLILDCYLGTARTAVATGEPEGAKFFDELSEEFVNIQWATEKSLELRDPQGIVAACAMSSFILASGLGGTELLSRARMFAHEIGNRQFEADCIFASAQIAIHRHEYEAAWKDYHSALNIYSAIRFPVGEAGCLTGLGKLASAFGNADDAYTLIMQGLEIFANYCDGPLASRGQAEGHYSLASLAMQQNNSAEALKQIAQALPFFTSTGDRGGEGKCDMLLGMLAFRRSDYDGARAHFKAALGIFETLAIPLSIAACLRDLGELEMACSRYTEAADYYQRALALFRIIGDGLGEAECLSALTTIQKAPK